MDLTSLLTGGGIVAVGGLIGIFLTRLLDSQNERKRWLRDQRLAAYLGLQKQCLEVSEGLAMSAKGSPIAGLTAATNATKMLSQEAEAIVLLGPKSVRQRVDAIFKPLEPLRQTGEFPSGVPAHVAHEEFRTAVGAFNTETRRVLKIPKD